MSKTTAVHFRRTIYPRLGHRGVGRCTLAFEFPQQFHSFLALYSTGTRLCIPLSTKQMCAELPGMICTQVWGGEKNPKEPKSVLYQLIPPNLCTASVMFKTTNTADKRHKEDRVKQWLSSILLRVLLWLFLSACEWQESARCHGLVVIPLCG